MNPTQFALLKLGLDALISIWANHANKPPGWKPSPEDWQKLADEVNAATPEAVDAAARTIVSGRKTATQG